MADTKLTALTAQAGAVVAADLFYGVDDPAGTPASVKVTGTQLKTFTSDSPTLVTPIIGVATGTSLALGGATLGSNALAVTGSVQASGQYLAKDGSMASPSYAFTNAATMGLYARTSTIFGFVVNSGERLSLTQSSLAQRNDAWYGWSASTDPSGSPDLTLFRDAANTLAQRNGTTAQQDRVYNTFTNSSNGEWGGFDWQTTSNWLKIGSSANGTGTQRPIYLATSGMIGLGGTTSSFPGIKQSGTNLQFKLADDSLYAEVFANNFWGRNAMFVGVSPNVVGFNYGFGGATTPYMVVSNTSGNNVGGIVLGSATSSFPALKRNTTAIDVRLADDSAYTNIKGKLTTETNYTAGAITDTGYLTIYDATGTAYKVACVAA